MMVYALVFLHMIPPETFIIAGSGMAGALVRSLRYQEKLVEAIRTVVIGTLTAVFIWPITSPLIETSLSIPLVMTQFQHWMLSGFITGAAGGILLGFVLDLMTRKDQDK